MNVNSFGFTINSIVPVEDQ